MFRLQAMQGRVIESGDYGKDGLETRWREKGWAALSEGRWEHGLAGCGTVMECQS